MRLPTGPPSYRCRASAVLELLPEPVGQSLLDIGSGAATWPVFLALRGFRVMVADISREACERQRRMAQGAGVHIAVHHGETTDLTPAQFDVLTAFEVLEHIQDDVAALRQWATLLREDGLLYLSVPAHHRRWSHLDEAAGHVRRYERDQLRDTIAAAGLVAETVWSYGFPLANIARFFKQLVERRMAAQLIRNHDIQERSALSGVHRAHKWLQLAAGTLATPMIRLQRFFYHRELGHGYLCEARKAPPG